MWCQPRALSPVCCVQGCRGLVLSLWCWGWRGCEPGSGHTERLVPCQQRALGRTGCSPACPRSQWLLVAWHSRAAAAAAAPHPAQAGCTGHPCSALADLPVPCWHTATGASKHPVQLPRGGRWWWATPTLLPPWSFRSPLKPLEWEYPYLTCKALSCPWWPGNQLKSTEGPLS